MHLPAVGTHVWRQCNTLAVARNYAEEDMRIWLPRIDKRYKFSGVTGPSFTLYEYGLACIYKLTGFSHTAHRWWSLFISFFSISGLFLLVRSFFSETRIALFSAAFLIAIPEFYYHSINAVPDLLALSFMLWGWLFFRFWIAKAELFNWLFASILLTLAGMVKLQFLIAGVPLGIELVKKGVFQNRRWLWSSILTALLTTAACAGWYAWARYLTFKDWLNEFVHDVRIPDSVSTFFRQWFQNAWSDVPETWVGYVMLPLLLLGLIILFRTKRSRIYAIGTFAGAFVIYFLLQSQFLKHGYYILFMAPFIVLTAAVGANRVIPQGKNYLFAFLFIGALTWSWIRMHRNWEPTGWRVPRGFTNAEFIQQAEKTTDTARRYVVGPDETGCVYFYYLHAKGFPWYQEKDSKAEMARWTEWGANGIITDRPELLQEYSDIWEWMEEKQVGSFHWYKLRPKKP